MVKANKKATSREAAFSSLQRGYCFFFGTLGCSGLVEFGFGVVVVELLFGEVPVVEEELFGEAALEPESLPATLMLSTTRRLPAKDCAIRFASSRSFAEGAEPLSSMESSVTLTATFELVRVGSLRKAVWMSFLI